MRCKIVFLLFLLSSASVATAQDPFMARHGIRETDVRTHYFTNATIVVSPGRVIDNGSLLVVGGRVRAVGADLTPPGDAVVHDLEGKTIYPGFIDPYSEYGLGHVGALNPRPESEGPRYEADAEGRRPWNEAIHAHRQWVDHFRPDAAAAEALMKRGVTVAQSARKDGIFRGSAFVVSLGTGRPGELILEPRSTQWLSFSKGSSRQQYPSSVMGSIALIRQTLYDARWYGDAAARGRDAEAPVPSAALEALARYEGVWVFETGDELSILRAAGIGRELGIPLIHVGSNREFQRIDAIRGLDAPLILPLSFPETPSVISLAEELDVTLADLRVWERVPSNAATLERAGVEFAFTGHGLRSGEDFLANLRTAIARGLTRETALAALTTIPARLAGVSGRVGTLEQGRLANFLVTDGDLFSEDEKAAIESVWIAGRLERELVPQVPFDLRGEYEVTIGGRTYTLRLSGERGALRGELIEGEVAVELSNIRESLDNLTFQVPMDRFDVEGITRFSIAEVRDQVVGQVNLPDGMPLAIMMDRRPATPETGPEEEPEGEPEEQTGLAAAAAEAAEDAAREKAAAVLREREILSRLTYPNVGLGYEVLPARQNVLVRNATIWTMESEGVLENADLLVVDGMISAVGSNLGAPRGAIVIDGTGKHVTPGIIDEHSHLAISGGVNEGSHAVTAEVRIGDVVDSDDVGIYRALAGGVTAAQLLHGSANPIGGQAQVIKMRWGRLPEEMKFAAAPPSIKFALGENVKQSNWGDRFTVRYPQTRMGVETIMKDRFLAAREYADGWRGWESARGRAREGMVRPRRDLQLETLVEILEGRRHIHSHSYVQSEILMLMRLAEELGFRVHTFTHILEGYKVAPEMAAHGSGASSFSDWWAYKFEVWDAIPHNPCLMHRAGVLTSINSDSAEMIRRLNQEAAKSVMYCGMDEIEAMAMVTLNPAKQLLVDDRVGSLRRGKDADFVIWSGHPLSMYSVAEQTWVDGIPWFTMERDTEVRMRLHEEKQALVQKALRAGGKSAASRGERSRSNPSGSEMLWDCDTVIDVWSAEGGAEW
jgi:imidazolonepropionase-like amidohydrolase